MEISPVLLQKGSTKLALYGLGSMRDERLNRMWQSKKVRFLRPEEDEDNDDEEGFFNLFTLHQNRDLGRGSKNCVQESMIPEWMDLVVWGHEHECLIDFFESVVGTFRITQPGSSVATSLVAGEAVRKKVGILDIKGKNFRLHTVPLTQVRSFVTAEVSLREHKANLDPEDPKIEEKMTKVLNEEVSILVLNAREKMNDILEEARAAGNNAGDEDSPLKYKLEKPNQVLVRIRVDHAGFESISNQRFGARFVGEVANPTDILLFSRRKEAKAGGTGKIAAKRRALMNAPIAPEALEKTNMEDLVLEHLEAPERKLKLLNKKKLSEALEEYVDKNTLATIADTTAAMLKEAQKKLISDSTATEDGEKASKIRERIEMESQAAEEKEEMERRKRRRLEGGGRGEEEEEEEEDDDDKVQVSRCEGNMMDSPDRGKENGHGEDDSMEPAPKTSSKRPSKRKGNTTRTNARHSTGADSQRKAARRRQLMDDDDEDEDGFGGDRDDELLDDEDFATAGRQAAASKSRTMSRPKRSATKRGKSYQESDDDDDNSDAAVENPGDDEDDMLEDDADVPIKKKLTSKKQTNAKQRAAVSSLKLATSSRSRISRLDDVDEDAEAYRRSVMDELDDDWGTAATRSQI